jgi:hypothetical protein
MCNFPPTMAACFDHVYGGKLNTIYSYINDFKTLTAIPARSGTVKDDKEIAIFLKGMEIDLPNSGVPSRNTQSEVKANPPRVEIKVMVHEKLTSQWNIAV